MAGVHFARGQSAMEYLITYSWAILIVAVAFAGLYFFVVAPQLAKPNTCVFTIGAYCQDLTFGSNSLTTGISIFLTNAQPFAVIAPQIQVNFSSSLTTGTCKPYYVQQGGAILCNATLSPNSIGQGTLVSGKLYASAIPCQSGNVVACQIAQRQTYVGTFTAQVGTKTAPPSVSISLAELNVSQLANGNTDKVTANVKISGSPFAGATVNFTANNGAIINPITATADGNGNAVGYVSSLTVSNVVVTAAFANTVASNVIVFH